MPVCCSAHCSIQDLPFVCKKIGKSSKEAAEKAGKSLKNSPTAGGEQQENGMKLA